MLSLDVPSLGSTRELISCTPFVFKGLNRQILLFSRISSLVLFCCSSQACFDDPLNAFRATWRHPTPSRSSFPLFISSARFRNILRSGLRSHLHHPHCGFLPKVALRKDTDRSLSCACRLPARRRRGHFLSSFLPSSPTPSFLPSLPFTNPSSLFSFLLPYTRTYGREVSHHRLFLYSPPSSQRFSLSFASSRLGLSPFFLSRLHQLLPSCFYANLPPSSNSGVSLRPS